MQNPQDHPSEAPGIVIAIDGPAASGKSSVARRVAVLLGYGYVNTGAMFRAVTWSVLEAGGSVDEEDSILEILAAKPLLVQMADNVCRLTVGGTDPEPMLERSDVAAAVSKIARHPRVRSLLVDLQRNVRHPSGLVVEGRDIGTVVFPTTPHKYFIDADPEVRAARRLAQGLDDSIRERDRLDSSRAVAPLAAASDATHVDSSRLTIEEVAGFILQDLSQKGGFASNHESVA